MTINNIMENLRENIEPYLLDELDKESMQEFERAMQANPQLNREVEQMRCIISSFEKRGESRALEAIHRLNSEEELRDIVMRAEGKADGHGRGRVARICLWSASVAVAAILIVSIGMQPKYSTEELYDSYFTAQQHFETTPSRGASVLSPERLEMLSSATELYHREEYSAAARIYERALDGVAEDEIPEDVSLFYAVSLVQSGIADQAIKVLRVVAENDEAELQDQARWNLALALMGSGQRSEAAAILDQLIRGKGEFSTQAEELKTKIKRRRWF